MQHRDGAVDLVERVDNPGLDDEYIIRLNQAVLVFLGLAVSPRAKREA
jgi:hypothetical protein